MVRTITEDDCINTSKNNIIDVSVLQKSQKKLRPELISPSVEQVESILVPEHTSEPIKNMNDIITISQHLISNKKYRDNMLFIVGINFGLRASDLRMLRFSNIINDNLTFKDTFAVFEQKTRNTRKRKKNRYITINTAVIEAITLYLENTPNISLSDYMFRSLSNRNKDINSNQPLSVKSIDRIVKSFSKELSINVKLSTHTLRKTFCYHQMIMSNNDGRKLLLLQKMLNHSSPAQTLDYIGITQEEIEKAYRDLNLGSLTQNYLVDSNILESNIQLIV